MSARFARSLSLALAVCAIGFSGAPGVAATPAPESETQLLEIIRQHPSVVKYVNDHPELGKLEAQKQDHRPNVPGGRDLNLQRVGHVLAVHDANVCDGFAVSMKNDGGTALDAFGVIITYTREGSHDDHRLEVPALAPNESKRVVDRNPPARYDTYRIFKVDGAALLSAGKYQSCLR